MMKNLILSLFIVLTGSLCYAQGGLEGVIVEEVDATVAGAGQIAYRVYVDLEAGYELQQVYGNTDNPLTVSTTTQWFNSGFGAEFGNVINAAFIGVFPELAFDSYVSLGGASSTEWGVIAADAPNGRLALSTVPAVSTLGAIDVAGQFGVAASPTANSLVADQDGQYFTLDSNGDVAPGNRIYIGQFTTDGDFSFSLNIQTRLIGTADFLRLTAAGTPDGTLNTYGPAVAALTYPAAMCDPADCDDGDLCTTEECIDDVCVNTPIDCDDGDACTTDSCAGGVCVNEPVDCDDADACTTDSCDPVMGCMYAAVDCDDADACTTDSCDPATGCVYTAVDCDDADACTTDSCDPATGCVYTAVDCDDADACTTDSCDPATGCVNTPIDCDDGDPTTADSCDNGVCINDPIAGTPGEDCANALVAVDGVQTSAGSLAIGGTGASNACFTGATGAVWYSYTASCTGFVTVSSSIDLDEPDTRVSIHSACDTLDCLASDDDGGEGFTSIATFEAVAGEEYFIEWDDRWDDGEFDFEVSCAPYVNGCLDATACNFNDAANVDDASCVFATGCDSCSGETDGTGTVVDNPEVGEMCDDGDTNTINDTVGADCVCVGEALTGCTDDTACNYDDDPALVTDNTLCIYATGCDTCSGETDGSGTVVDNPEVGEACDDGDVTTANDTVAPDCVCTGSFGPGATCDDAIAITAGVHTSVGTAATGGGGASGYCGATGSVNSIYYEYTATGCDTVIISSSIDLDEPDTRVLVYTDCLVDLCVAADDDSGAGFTSIAAFISEPGQTYIIEWDDRWDDGEFDFEISTSASTADCDDGDACTMDEFVCGVGCTNTAIDCDDADACTTDSCDPATGCVNTPIDCDDADACTTDSCDPATGCVYTAVDCDDADACTMDSCDPATGCVYTAVDCDDADACTTDSCDPATGCVNTPIDCDDGDACTTDSCDPATGCVYTAVDCDDGDPNTMDSCDPATGCINTPIGGNLGDACDNAIVVTDGVTTSLGVDSIGSGNIGACATGTNSVWYEYTATCDGITTVSSSIDLDEPDTQVHIYADCDSTCIASDDDSGEAFTSIATFMSVAGDTYYIEWDDRWDNGEFDFEISCAPVVEGCTNAAACNYNDAANVDDATCIFAAGCDTCSGETDGTGTVVDNPEVGEMCDDGDANTINDEVQNDCTCQGDPLVFEDGQDCSATIEAFDGVTTSAGVDSLGFSNPGACGTGDNSVWYSYTATCTGTTTVTSTIDLDEPDTFVSIYAHCDSTCIASDDDGGAGFTSLVEFAAVAGETYLIEWNDRWDDGEFDFEISCTPDVDCPDLGLNIGDACDDGNPETEGDVVTALCECVGIDPCPNPVNDDAAGALANSADNIWGVPGWDTFDVTCATLSMQPCDGNATSDSWYSFVAQAENQGILARSNPSDPGAASADMAIEVFDAALVPLAGTTGGACTVSRSCFNNSGAGEIERAVPGGLTVGDTYYYRVYDAAGGDLTLVDTKVKTYAPHPIVNGCTPTIGGPTHEWTMEDPSNLYNIPPVPVFFVRMVMTDASGAIIAMTPPKNPIAIGGLEFAFNEFAPAVGPGNYNVHAQNEVKMMANGCISAYWSQLGPGCPVEIGAPANNSLIASNAANDIAFTAYPNPNTGDQVFLELVDFNDVDADVIVSIVDMYGKQVHMEQFANSVNDSQKVITFDQNLSAGMYFINLTVNERVITQKLVVQ